MRHNTPMQREEMTTNYHKATQHYTDIRYMHNWRHKNNIM